ncbi:MAG: hypothetical protein PHR47_01655 [Candidatus Pacebacteria bacterium]|nr:hypothetical protein [Candidatus Paceibacterota bacterium]
MKQKNQTEIEDINNNLMAKKILPTKNKTLAKKTEVKKNTKKSSKPLKTISKKIVKKIVKKAIVSKPIKKLIIKKEIKEKKLGKVLHFYDKIKVLVIKLKDDIVVGDMVRIKGGKETNFKQKIVSIELNREKIKKAKKNQCIGFKVKEKVRPGYWVYKI